MKFIDRKAELKLLKAHTKTGGLIIVYGRRRVGKTTLLRQLPGRMMYYLVKEQPISQTLQDLNNKFIKEFKYLELLDYPITSFAELFEFLSDKKIIFILDEFPFLLKDKSILGYLQEFLDKKPPTTIILCGSYMSAMEKVRGYASPIYGRRMLSIKLTPLPFKYVTEFFPKIKASELVNIYAVLGGVPEYLLHFEKNFNDFIAKHFWQKSTYLYEEAELLLRYELRELSSYNAIIKAISIGLHSLHDIAQESSIDKNSIVRYLDVLMGLDIVQKSRPYLSMRQDRLKERNNKYTLKDNYFHFYFQFIYPFQEDINFNLTDRVQKHFKKYFPAYLQIIFKDIAQQFLVQKLKISFGAQWGKYLKKEGSSFQHTKYQIDLMGWNDQEKVLYAFIVDYQDLNKLDIQKHLEQLQEEIKAIPEDIAPKQIKLGVIAKKIMQKSSLVTKDIMLYELKDIFSA